MSAQKFYRDAYIELEDGHGYDPASEPTFNLRIGAALNIVGSVPKRILDFGCGAGDASKRFVESGHQVVGIDISATGIKLAKEKVPGAEFELIHSESEIPLSDHSFDVCFCSEVIEHLLDGQGFIRETYRLLVPGGLFLITVPYHGWIKNLLIITFGFESHFHPDSGHIRFFSKRSISQSLQTGGFCVERITGIGRRPVWKTMFIVARKPL